MSGVTQTWGGFGRSWASSTTFVGDVKQNGANFDQPCAGALLGQRRGCVDQRLAGSDRNWVGGMVFTNREAAETILPRRITKEATKYPKLARNLLSTPLSEAAPRLLQYMFRSSSHASLKRVRLSSRFRTNYTGRWPGSARHIQSERCENGKPRANTLVPERKAWRSWALDGQSGP